MLSKDGILTQWLLTKLLARRAEKHRTCGRYSQLADCRTRAKLRTNAQEMGTGLVVTELMGQGVSAITGDYSRGAAGFWVENGEIQYPVSEITIAGNLKEYVAQYCHRR